MPINWTIFKQNITKFFDDNRTGENKNPTAKTVSTKIANEYETAIKLGGDLMYMNPATVYNKPGLQISIQNAFELGRTVPSNSVIPTLFGGWFSTGLIQFWTGAQLGILIPPPGSVSVVSNMVISPGAPVPVMNIKNTDNKNEFVDSMIDLFKLHLQSVSGTTIALVPAVPSPIPTPFPWIGYG